MMSGRKFSISAIILMLLLVIRFVSQIFAFSFVLAWGMDIVSILFLGITAVLVLFYGIALVGVVRKTSWGINLVIAIAMLDVVIVGVFDLLLGTFGSASSVGVIIVDLVLLLLAGNIAKRIRR